MANLRFLRRLVTTLTAVMIFGLLTIVALLVIRLAQPSPAPTPTDFVLPAQISLPEGQTALAVTQGPDWFAIVTDRNEIFIFDGKTGAQRQRIKITE